MWRVSGGEWVNNREKKSLKKEKNRRYSDIHLLILEVSRGDKTILLSKSFLKLFVRRRFRPFYKFKKILFSVT